MFLQMSLSYENKSRFYSTIKSSDVSVDRLDSSEYVSIVSGKTRVEPIYTVTGVFPKYTPVISVFPIFIKIVLCYCIACILSAYADHFVAALYVSTD